MKILANDVIQTLKAGDFASQTFKIGKATLKKLTGPAQMRRLTT